MADIRISQLPTAPSAITGAELVPVVQNGLTVQTTVSAITQSPSLTQTFLTVGVQTGLPNSRYFSTGTGLGITDGGAQSPYTISLNGTSGSLENASAGVIVKTAANTIAARTLSTSGNGISVTNGNGIAGNPTFQLTGLAQAIANASGTGILALNGGSTISPVTITGTSNQIGVTGGDGSSAPTISLASNFIAPGTAGITLPNGTTAQRGATTGQIRYNTDTARFEGYYAGSWQTFGIGDGTVTSVSGTTNQIDVNNVGSIATVSMSANPIVPGNSGFVVPVGTTAQRNPSPTNGTLRYNSSLGLFEGYANGVWGAITTGSGVTSVATGTGLTGGPITSTGTISIANTAVTAAAYGSSYQVPTFTVNAQGQLTLASNTTIDAVTLTTGSITTTPSGANDIANKSYVDSVAQGLDAKASCVVATTVNLAALSGLLTIDGVTVVAGDRVLVKNQTLSQNNGIYLAASGAWTRALDMDVWAEVPNAFTFIETGSTQADTGWVTTANQAGTIGVTAMPWTQFSGAGTYTAGTGLTLTGTQFSITNTAVTAAAYGSASSVATFTVNAQGQLTLAASTPIAIANTAVSGLGTMSTQNANSVAITGGAISDTSITVKDNVFTLQDNLDPTKQAQFELSGLTTGTTFTYTLPAQTGTIPVLGGINSWTGNNVFANVNGTFGSSAGASTINVASGATTTGVTKTVNVGTGGLSGSTTNIAIGGTAGTSTTTMNGTTNFLDSGLTIQNAADTTKKATFSLAGLTTGTSVVYTMPAATGTIAALNASQTFSAGNTFSSPTNNFGSSANTGTTNLGSGGTSSGNTKTVNVGTGGLSGSTTNITVGTNVSGATSTTTLYGDVAISSTSALTIPVGTTAQRPTSATGMLRFNSTTTTFEGYNGTAWSAVGGGSALSNDTTTATNLYPLFANATSGIPTTIYTGNANLLYKPSTGELQSQALVAINGLTVNNATVNTSYTIPTGYNAISAGPITVASGIVVTVPSGSTWVIA
jgi:hypothetical protein